MSKIIKDNFFDYNFSKDLIINTRDLNKLLTMEIELSYFCNYRCRYCYSGAASNNCEVNDLEHLKSIITQAKDMGVRFIVLIGGGETLLYVYIKELIEFIYLSGIEMAVFTNGSALDEELAQFLYDRDVYVMLKVNGYMPKTINWLCGNINAFRYTIRAMNALWKVGYGKNRRLGISTIICKQNYGEIEELWKWCRDNEIIPYFERVIVQGRASSDLSITVEELKEKFQELEKIDRCMYGIEWELAMQPIAGMNCKRHYYSIYLKVDGSVQPCSGIDIHCGSTHIQSLNEIILKSEVIQQLRHVDENIKGKCKVCENREICYGCRGNAYQITKDYLETDPYCWFNNGS